MTVGVVSADGQTCIEKQDATVGPRRQKTTFVRRRVEGRVIFLQSGVDVLERRWGGCWGTNGEAEAVGLVEVVVGVLAEDDGFDGGERCVTGPMSGNQH